MMYNSVKSKHHKAHEQPLISPTWIYNHSVPMVMVPPSYPKFPPSFSFLPYDLMEVYERLILHSFANALPHWQVVYDLPVRIIYQVPSFVIDQMLYPNTAFLHWQNLDF